MKRLLLAQLRCAGRQGTFLRLELARPTSAAIWLERARVRPRGDLFSAPWCLETRHLDEGRSFSCVKRETVATHCLQALSALLGGYTCDLWAGSHFHAGWAGVHFDSLFQKSEKCLLKRCFPRRATLAAPAARFLTLRLAVCLTGQPVDFPTALR